MQYPDVYYSCEKASSDNQRKFLVSRGVEFVLLILAAGLGEIPRSSFHGAGPVAAFGLFLLALIIRSSGVGDTAEKRWYDARAASESIKSAAWQFAVKCKPYDSGDSDAKGLLVDLLKNVLKRVPKLEVNQSRGTNAVVSQEMSEIRSQKLEDRIAKYKEERVEDQITWYKTKAKINKTRAKIWRVALIMLESVAVILGFIRVLGAFDVNWVGILATAAAGVAAWQQTRNFTFLSESYSVTTLELSFVLDTFLNVTDENGWSDAARDAESAFSREHGLWLVRRQLKSD